MSLPPPEHESFKIRLRQAIDDADLSIYALARKLDPENPQRAERYLYRWLSPSSTTVPSVASREALARALGKDADFFVLKLGVKEMLEIARAHAEAELHEETIRRRAFCPPGGPYGGHYLTEQQRELIQA